MKQQTPKWLEDLQENSWELELLISGGAIFSLFQASDYFADSFRSLDITTGLTGHFIYILLGSFGIKLLTLGFILHLVLRAFWLALVCINYVYPQGIHKKNISIKKPFKANVEEGQDLYNAILRTDHFCGIVMFMSIISTFLLAGIMLLFLILITLPGSIPDIREHPIFWAYSEVISICIIIYLLDLLLFGLLRKIPVLSYLLFPFFWLFDQISLRFLFQQSLWHFSTNISKARFAFLYTLFLVVAFLFSYRYVYKTFHWPNFLDPRNYRNQLAGNIALRSAFYMDELEGGLVQGVAIPSKIIDKPYLELFIIYRKKYDWDMKQLPDSMYLSDLVQVKIDDSLLQSLEWFPHIKQENDQLGITSLIPIQHLKQGRHMLHITSTVDTSRKELIPFWTIKSE